MYDDHDPTEEQVLEEAIGTINQVVQSLLATWLPENRSDVVKRHQELMAFLSQNETLHKAAFALADLDEDEFEAKQALATYTRFCEGADALQAKAAEQLRISTEDDEAYRTRRATALNELQEILDITFNKARNSMAEGLGFEEVLKQLEKDQQDLLTAFQESEIAKQSEEARSLDAETESFAKTVMEDFNAFVTYVQENGVLEEDEFDQLMVGLMKAIGLPTESLGLE